MSRFHWLPSRSSAEQTYVCFLFSERLVAFLGKNGMNVVTRLMGLIVASIGVSMLLAGLEYHPAPTD
jgi:small neutral amino acid transporter SnatA (MarC family)